MSVVTLTPEEHINAYRCGVQKFANEEAAHKNNAHGMRAGREESKNRVCQGLIAECVASKWLGVEWCPSLEAVVDTDIGRNVDVKAGTGSGYGLLVQAAHLKRECIYVLVVPERGWGNLDFRVAGWMWGSEVEQYLATNLGKSKRRPAPYLVPQDHLRDGESLKRLIERQHVLSSEWWGWSDNIPRLGYIEDGDGVVTDTGLADWPSESRWLQ